MTHLARPIRGLAGLLLLATLALGGCGNDSSAQQDNTAVDTGIARSVADVQAAEAAAEAAPAVSPAPPPEAPGGN